MLFMFHITNFLVENLQCSSAYKNVSVFLNIFPSWEAYFVSATMFSEVGKQETLTENNVPTTDLTIKWI